MRLIKKIIIVCLTITAWTLFLTLNTMVVYFVWSHTSGQFTIVQLKNDIDDNSSHIVKVNNAVTK